MSARPYVVVTGAAGAIGSATVRSFRAADHPVVAVDVAEIDVQDAEVQAVRADVADEHALAAALGEVAAKGPLGHVVGIAGGALPEEPSTQDDPLALSLDVFRASVERNLTSQFVVLRTCLAWLRRSGPGDRSITFTSSWNALTGQGMPAYSAAKAGLIGMVRALADPLGSEGIRVNAVAPGTIRTPRTERIWAHVPGHFDALAATTALGRIGTPEDVATAFRVLALDLRHVTGEVLVVDGGQNVRRR